MAGFALTLTAVSIVFIALTYGMYRFFPEKRLLLYLPSILALLGALYYFYIAKTVENGFADLAGVVMSIIFFAGFIAGIITGVFFDFILPRMKH